MPMSKTKAKNAVIAARMAALPSNPKELIDRYLAGPMTGEAVNEATAALKKALIERAQGAESSRHLGYPSGAATPLGESILQRMVMRSGVAQKTRYNRKLSGCSSAG